MNQRTFAGLSIVGLVMFAAAPLWIARAPYESTMGLIQKIFYFHVPGWIVMFLAVFVAGIASAIHLFRQKPAAKHTCLLYTYPSPRDRTRSRMPSSA